MPVNELASGNVIVALRKRTELEYSDVINVSLGRDWVFIKFSNCQRTQIPRYLIRSLDKDEKVFVKGVKNSSD